MVSAPLRSWHATRAARELPDSDLEHGISLPWAIHSTQPGDWLLKALVSHCTLDRIEHPSAEAKPVRAHTVTAPAAASMPPRLGHRRFVVSCPLTLLRQRFLCGSCSSAHDLRAPIPFRTRSPHAVALHFAHCAQLAAGLAPAGMRPCWVHHKKTHLKNQVGLNWLREKDLNLRPLGYEPNELPDCSIARQK